MKRKRDLVPVTNRAGIVLIMVLMAVLLAAAAGVSMTQAVALHHRQLEGHQHSLQAELIAQSAIDRAAAALRTSPELESLQWSPVLPGGQYKADVTIKLTPANTMGRRSAVITVQLRDESTIVARHEIECEIQATPPQER
ncbi:hypothetical protein [Planctomicrobium piriforme]|uniref:Type II secretory pathway, pseudopilin PulG n=1 Tax=Planctomicrobium piriforme TaxID=1576369 RepID=A0A1I3FEN6_9PLAN|nr:hypothetical protein [Planctomicrobium piriforme]SFI09678.1 hypothetical protein SAMN05421753_105211 [Planctomicrobium piriforme]